MSEVPMPERGDSTGGTQQPGPSLPLERAGLAPQSRADQRGAETSVVRRYRIEAIRILPPQQLTLTDEQETRAVAVLSELLMPLLRGRLLDRSREGDSPEPSEAT